VPTIPRGEVLGTYETYPEAQAVVDRLAKADFDLAQLAIVGNDLHTVERVTGKLTYGRSAGAGAASGAWFGLFAGILLFMFTATPNLGFAIAAVVIGAGFGMLFGIVAYGVNRSRRDFTSTHQVIASSYQVIVPSEKIARAQALLERPVS
jgi:uncharacterized membrane protein